MRLTKERSFDLSAGLKCRMGCLLVERDGPSIYTTYKRDCSVVRTNRESKSIDTFAKTTDKCYAYAHLPLAYCAPYGTLTHTHIYSAATFLCIHLHEASA